MADTPEDAWRAGRTAALARRITQTNPYPEGSDLALDWASGWREGMHVRNQRPPDPPQATYSVQPKAAADPSRPSPH